MNSSDFSVLIHTFDGYAFAWDGFVQGWKTSRMDLLNKGVPVYWGTDVKSDRQAPFTPLYSGPGQWSDRLKVLLTLIPSDTIFYMQEDHWPKKPIDLNHYYQIFRKNSLFRLQLSPIVRYYTIYGENAPYFFDEKPKSKYLVAHNPGFWDKKFLLSCLEKGENPWLNEYKGTCRLWERSKQIEKKIAIYPVDWYFHAVEHGKLVKTKTLV